MNILVTGANGQLGNELQIVSRDTKSDHYIFSDVCGEYYKLDITHMDAIQQTVEKFDVQCIINCAAWTNVDKAETAGDIVEQLNAVAPGYLAKVMKARNGLLIHISTDYVFGKEPYNTPCREDQQGTPTGIYGLTKLHGEQNIIASGCKHIIIRTAWLYSEFGHNFLKTMLQLTATQPQVNVVIDQCGTPTYAGDLAKAIFDILENRKYEDNEGIYHFSNEGVTSWFDFAKEIAAMAGHTECDIRSCHSHEFPSPVKRPAYSVLDKTKFKQTFKVSIPYWRDSLKFCEERLLHSPDKNE